jgi:hypothetical protein
MSNVQKVDMNEIEQKVFDEKKKFAADAYAKRKDEARNVIMKYFESDESNRVPQNVKTAILYISGKGVRSERSGITSELKDLLLKGPMTLMSIFEKFEYGRPAMEQRIRGFINVTHVEDRIWVDFKDGKYTIVGKGENPPKGWAGYVPKVKVETETL